MYYKYQRFLVFADLNFLYSLKITNNMKITKKAAKMGANIEMIDMATDVPVSSAETTGLPKPPVVAVDANRVVLDVPATAAAVPPPAIMANDHITTGLKSATVESIIAVPANAANGTAILSSRLSM